jgi:DNA-binding NarL/FixJ family response regulator
MTINVSIVEDDNDIRESLCVLISGSEGFNCISSHKNAESALRNIARERPDVVLMDINLPGASGIECVKNLKKILPDINILMLTVYDDSKRIFDSLSAGANGYLLKRTPPSLLLDAIKEVNQGGSPMSGQIARMVVESFRKFGDSNNEMENLTKREEEILSLLAKGYKYKEIGDTLFIGVETVRSHLRRIYEKLHVRSRTEAAVKYLHG